MKDLAVGAKHRSSAKGLPFDIDAEHLLALWEENDGCCCVTGDRFDLTYHTSKQTGWSKRLAPSIDRVVPELGYTKGNVRLVTFQVNCAKSLYTEEDFYDMCEKALKRKAF